MGPYLSGVAFESFLKAKDSDKTEINIYKDMLLSCIDTMSKTDLEKLSKDLLDHLKLDSNVKTADDFLQACRDIFDALDTKGVRCASEQYDMYASLIE